MAIKNRRQGPDSLVKAITYISAAAVLIIIIVLLIYSMKNPTQGSLYSMRTGGGAGGKLGFSFKAMLFLNFLLAVTGMVIHTMRNKRKTDHFHVSLVIAALLSLAALIFLNR